jgi:hypothetical protein
MELNSIKSVRLGDHEQHVVELDPSIVKSLDLGLNPLGAHFAIELDDIQALKKLTVGSEKWTDWSRHGGPGRGQLFKMDTGRKLFELHLTGKLS